MASTLRIAVAAAVTVGCLYLALRGAEWGEVWAVLGRTDYVWLAIMVGVSVLVLYIRALRWRVLLEPAGRVAIRPLFSATAVGFMANMLLPLRAGEVIRPVMLGRQTGVSTSAAFASVMLERLLDTLLICCFLLALSVAVPVPDAMQRASYVVAGAVAVLLVGLVALLRFRGRAVVTLRRVLKRLFGSVGSQIADVLENFVQGLSGINERRTAAVLCAYTLAVWLVITSTFTCALLALNVNAPLAAASVSLVVVVAAFVSLPQAPGYIGTWQAGFVTALAFYGVSQEEAIGLSLITHAIQLLVVVAVGALCLAAEDLRVGELMALTRGRRKGDQ